MKLENNPTKEFIDNQVIIEGSGIQDDSFVVYKKIEIKVYKTAKGIELPKYETPGSAGFDFKSVSLSGIAIFPGERKLIPTGLYVEIPEGYEMQVRSKSGLTLKKGVIVLNAPGTIDSDYRGEIGVILYNAGTNTAVISYGDKIAQGVVSPVSQAVFKTVKKLDDLSDTDRGVGGYGSTGK